MSAIRVISYRWRVLQVRNREMAFTGRRMAMLKSKHHLCLGDQILSSV